MIQQNAEELREFHQFVGHKLDQGAAKLSPEEVLDEWRDLHPDERENDNSPEVVRAVRQALADMDAGDRGTAAAEVLAELRNRLSSQGKQ
jgi:hypothetical protein